MTQNEMISKLLIASRQMGRSYAAANWIVTSKEVSSYFGKAILIEKRISNIKKLLCQK
jgi:hypothetical protein